MINNAIDKIMQFVKEPPVNIEGLIRAFNIDLVKNADLHPNILGELRKDKDGSYRISIQKNDHYYRKRFTMAHELAHYLLHHEKIGDGIDDNVKYRSSTDGNYYNQRITDKEETEANQLAASLLMPEQLLLPYVAGLRANDIPEETIGKLAKIFQVSTVAMGIRLRSLASSQQQKVSVNPTIGNQ